MIWFDNLRSVATASYYVQQLYGTNRGERVVPLTLDGKPVTGADGQQGLYATAAVAEGGKEYIIKVVNTADEPRELKIDFKGVKGKKLADECRVTTLSSADGPDVDNVEGLTERIKPVTSKVECGDGMTLNYTIPAKTFAVIVR